MPTVLFVCTANRSRSPVAAACLQKELDSHELGANWRVASAGTWATDGQPPTPDAVLAARQMGLDISGHRSTRITAEAINNSDLILVMEEGQKEALEIEFPTSAPRLHLLTQAATGIPYSIPDPAGSSSASGVYNEIAEMIHAGFGRLKTMAAAG